MSYLVGDVSFKFQVCFRIYSFISLNGKECQYVHKGSSAVDENFQQVKQNTMAFKARDPVRSQIVINNNNIENNKHIHLPRLPYFIKE